MLRAASMALLLAAVSADFVAPSYTMDLDKSAYDRLEPIVNDIVSRHGYENTWAPLHAFLENVLTHKEWVESVALWDEILASYPPFYQEEVFAFHDWVKARNHSEWTLGQIVMCQLFYEVEDACTSIVAQHTNGTIFHGRNLDYGLPGLANMTTQITFVKNGTRVGRGTMYLGYCGVLTGQKLNGQEAAWSVSLDQRFYGKHVVPYIDTVKEILAGTQNVGFTLRDAVTSPDLPDWNAATRLLKDKEIPAPAYLIVGGRGNDEGVVITRDRNGTSHAAGTGRGYWRLNTEGGEFYRAETNFDNWEPFTDGRRKVANEGMRANGQSGANLTGLFNVLSADKVLNGGTTYTALMQNDADYFHTIVRTHDQSTDEARRAAMAKSVRAKVKDLLSWWAARKAQ